MKLKMTIAEALEFADEWSKGMIPHTLHEGSQGWRVVCMLLADEVRRLEVIEQAAINLCRVKGRYHTEQAMCRLMTACGFEKPNAMYTSNLPDNALTESPKGATK